MKTEALDTNVLLRAVDSNRGEQTEAAVALLTDRARRFSVSLTALAEFVYVLSRHYSKERSAVAMLTRELIAADNIACDRNVIVPALDLYETHPKLSFEDCLIAEQARVENAAPLWTFDAKLAKQHPIAKLVR